MRAIALAFVVFLLVMPALSFSQVDDTSFVLRNGVSIGYDRLWNQNWFGARYQHRFDSLYVSLEVKGFRRGNFPVPDYHRKGWSISAGFNWGQKKRKWEGVPLVLYHEWIVGYQGRHQLNTTSKAIENQPYSSEKVLGIGWSARPGMVFLDDQLSISLDFGMLLLGIRWERNKRYSDRSREFGGTVIDAGANIGYTF
ncbi:MAG: hypothetical protein ABEH43_03830 [Flavobacteriales bacterium]